MFKSPFESLVDVLTIESCVLCQKTPKILCSSCFQANFSELDLRCYNCNKITKGGRVCKSCKSRSHLRRVWWLGNYKGVLKDLVWNVKYQRQRSTARLLGEYLASALPYLPDDTLVVPLPTASSRVRKRGYDQAKILAHSFAKTRRLPYQDVLVRKDQKELIGKRRSDRINLMENSFAVKSKSNLEGKSILLIDDVLTTGASLESAAKVLRKNGAKHVDAAVICRRLLN